MVDPLYCDPFQEPNLGHVGLVTTFYSRIVGGYPPYQVLWDFGDGNTSRKRDTYHVFQKAGFYNVKITVTDAASQVFETYVAVDVEGDTPPPPSQVPVITSPLSVSAAQNAPFSYQIVATHSPTNYDATGLPPGLSIDTGTGLISGTPTDIGTTNVTLSAINGAGTGQAVLSITVEAVSPPVFDPATDLCADQTQYNSFQITVEVNPANPPSWNVTGLPDGMWYGTMGDRTLVIYGTPTASGVFPITISATNVAGQTDLNINVNVPALEMTVSGSLSSDGVYRRCEEGHVAFNFGSQAWERRTGSTFVGTPYIWRRVGDPSKALFYCATNDMWVIGDPLFYNGSPNLEGQFSNVAGQVNGSVPAQGYYESAYGSPLISSNGVNCAPNAPYLPDASILLIPGVDFVVLDAALTAVDAWTFQVDSVPPGMNFDTQTGIFTGNLPQQMFQVQVTVFNGAGSYTATFSFSVMGAK